MNKKEPSLKREFGKISFSVPYSLLSMFDEESNRRGYTRSEALRAAMRQLLEGWLGRRL